MSGVPTIPDAGDDAPEGKVPARIDERLDCTGLRCPLPLLRTKQLLNRMAPGTVLEVVATDSGARRDIPAYLRQSTHRLMGLRESAGALQFWIERGA